MSASLLSILTERILADELSVEDARAVVIRHEHYKRVRPVRPTLRQIEDAAIREALERHDGNCKQAAEELGIGITTIYRRKP